MCEYVGPVHTIKRHFSLAKENVQVVFERLRMPCHRFWLRVLFIKESDESHALGSSICARPQEGNGFNCREVQCRTHTNSLHAPASEQADFAQRRQETGQSQDSMLKPGLMRCKSVACHSHVVERCIHRATGLLLLSVENVAMGRRVLQDGRSTALANQQRAKVLAHAITRVLPRPLV